MSSLFELIMAWVITVDPASVVIGMLLGHGAVAVTNRIRRPARSERESYWWNAPEVLPPVGCPLVLNLGPEYDWDIAHGERVSHLSDRGGVMEYRLSTGQIIRGRFAWSYP